MIMFPVSITSMHFAAPTKGVPNVINAVVLLRFDELFAKNLLATNPPILCATRTTSL